MRELHGVMLGARGGYFELRMALWNAAAQCPEAHVIGTPGHNLPDLDPFTLAGVSECAMPPVDRSLWPAGDLTRDEALAIINEQRRYRQPDGSIRVAGFSELTAVTEHGVTTEELIRWPDRIGRKVNPEPELLRRLASSFRQLPIGGILAG